ncbi:probable arabinosyltransferase ARAD1 [Magnolia sinica]|uniref:probable arabinosyltransferase ARAD1 n=1 Tax=Magnolia sinica TaxID=86752 RepID=UPI0026585D15|nr:probable arabinosyltransferase ARAD1 [Magnolia sinica]
MAERNPRPTGILSQKSIFFFFTILAFLITFSWFFFLRSAGHPNFIDHNFLSNAKLFAVIDDGNSSSHNPKKVQPLAASSLFSTNEEDNGQEDEEFKKCNPNKAVLKVFMYDLPPEFHFGMLDWKGGNGSVWPDLQSEVPHYPGGLNLQHSIEYWLTLDLLSSQFANWPGPCSAIRVENSTEADVVFVPFFSSLSYNRHSKVTQLEKISRNNFLQAKLVQFLIAQEEWKRSGGRDHVILAHHPNSMLEARKTLWPAILILSDFGRYPPNIANVEKDVIAPYKHVIHTIINDIAGFNSRPTLLYFQGAIYRKDGGFIRQELFYLLKNEKDVHFTFGSVSRDGIKNASKGMHSSKFCLNIAGDTPSSNRLFDAIASHCVPVIISDEIELPYEDVLDYSKFCIFVRTSEALKKGFLINLIRSIGEAEWTKMWERMKEIERHFEFQYPSKKEDAVQMIWQAVARKVSAVRLKVHRSRRFAWSDISNNGRKRNPFRRRKGLVSSKHSKTKFPFETF